MNPYMIDTIVNIVATSLVSFSVGSAMLYYFEKNALINEAINGKQPLIRERPYKSFVNIFTYGIDLARKRFQAGKFDKIIASHKV